MFMKRYAEWVLRGIVAAYALHGCALAAQTPATPVPLQVAFTFDDLPAHGPLPPGAVRADIVKQILATLKDEHMPPVYGFVNGFRLTGYPYQAQILRDWLWAGNPLGSHTFSHLSLDVVSADRFNEDIADNESVLQKIDPTGHWHWFRYPFLDEGNTQEKRRAVRGYLKEHDYQIAEVTMDFEDYLWNEPYARCMTKHSDADVSYLEKSYINTADEYIDVFRDLSKQLYGRDIPYVLLMHVGAFDARMLPKLIALFRQKGFTFVTLQKAQSDPAYRFDPDIGYAGGGTMEELVAKVKSINYPDNTKPYKELEKICR
jgi:peptidoglycan/xylan/chitin deacetylase (PgdA/CDA1 family)